MAHHTTAMRVRCNSHRRRRRYCRAVAFSQCVTASPLCVQLILDYSFWLCFNFSSVSIMADPLCACAGLSHTHIRKYIYSNSCVPPLNSRANISIAWTVYIPYIHIYSCPLGTREQLESANRAQLERHTRLSDQPYPAQLDCRRHLHTIIHQKLPPTNRPQMRKELGGCDPDAQPAPIVYSQRFLITFYLCYTLLGASTPHFVVQMRAISLRGTFIRALLLTHTLFSPYLSLSAAVHTIFPYINAHNLPSVVGRTSRRSPIASRNRCCACTKHKCLLVVID